MLARFMSSQVHCSPLSLLLFRSLSPDDSIAPDQIGPPLAPPLPPGSDGDTISPAPVMTPPPPVEWPEPPDELPPDFITEPVISD